jgi:hypothetical protein
MMESFLTPYLVQAYPEALHITGSSGNISIDLAKSPSWSGQEPLHEVVAWLESAVVGGVAYSWSMNSQETNSNSGMHPRRKQSGTILTVPASPFV